MNEVYISRITVDNPHIAAYVKKIQAWDDQKKFKMRQKSFYAVYFNDMFSAASTIRYNPITSSVKILLLNGNDRNYDFVQKESTNQLIEIALKEHKRAKRVAVNSQKQLIKL